MSNYCSKDSSPNNKDKSTTVQGSKQLTRSTSNQKRQRQDSSQFTQTLVPIQIDGLDQDKGKQFYHIKTTEYKNYKYQKHDLKDTKFNFLQNIKMMQPVNKNSKWRNYSNYLPRVSLSALKNEYLFQNTLSDYLIEECAMPKLVTNSNLKIRQRLEIAELLQQKIKTSEGNNDIMNIDQNIKIKRFMNNFSILQQEKPNQLKKRLLTNKCTSLPHLVSPNIQKCLYQKEKPYFLQMLSNK